MIKKKRSIERNKLYESEFEGPRILSFARVTVSVCSKMVTKKKPESKIYNNAALDSFIFLEVLVFKTHMRWVSKHKTEDITFPESSKYIEKNIEKIEHTYIGRIPVPTLKSKSKVIEQGFSVRLRKSKVKVKHTSNY